MLTSTNVSEPGTFETAYNSGTTYALNDTVSVISTNFHHKYTSLVAGNIDHAPASSPTYWFDNGATNRWAMFDLSRNSQTTATSPITVTVTPGQRINSVFCLGMVGNSLTISATSVLGGGSVYSQTFDLNTREVLDSYMYCFEPFSFNPSIVVFDIPPYTDIIVTISVSSTSGNVSMGACGMGTYVTLGTTEYQAVRDYLNFSTVTRDVFGNAVLVPRKHSPKTSQKVVMDKSRINKVIDTIDALNAIPAVFSGVDDPEDGFANSLLIVGIIKSAPISLDGPTWAVMTLELEEI